MELTRLVKLLSRVDAALEADQPDGALELIWANFDHSEDAALLRERVATALAISGRKRQAVQVWDQVARHWANAGFPTRSLAAIKHMQVLQPDTSALLDHFTALYNIQSPYLDQAMELPELSPQKGPVDLEPSSADRDQDGLLDACFERASVPDGLCDEPTRLPAIPLLSMLPSESLRRVLDHLTLEVFADDEPLVSEGEFARQLLWTVTSDFSVDDDDDDDDGSKRLPSGALVGLNAFGPSGSAIRRDIYGQKNAKMLRLDEAAIDALDRELGDFRNRLATLRRHGVTEGLLERHPVFANLDADERTELIKEFTGLRVSKGELVVGQGDRSPGLCMVLDGEADIVRHEDGWEITIATLKAGEIFGEVGLVSDKPTPASCVMSTPGHVLWLDRQEFETVAGRFPGLAKYAVNVANKRVAEIETTLSAKDLAEVD